MNRLSGWKRFAAGVVALIMLVGLTGTAFADSAVGTATSNVIVREKKSTSSAALSTIKKGGTVTVLEISGDWVKVKDGSRTGYVSLRYLDIDGNVKEASDSSTSSSSSSSSSSALRKGDENDDVEDMQELLIALGYLDTDATGYFGSATEKAVKAFQRDAGISADGVAGSKTMNALEEAVDDRNALSSSSAMQRGDEGSDVTQLQKMLIELGYLSTDATGYFGSATEKAVIKFQEDNDLDADGVAGKATLASLQKKTGGSSSSSSAGVLREGDENDDVKSMQKKLIQLGYLNTDATGFFGSATAAAVRAFQKAYDLDADGVVGSATMKALNNAVDEEDDEDEAADSGNTAGEPHTEVEETQQRNGVVLEDWWSGKIDAIISRGDTYKVTDVLTGKSFTAARYGGNHHLDSEPYSAQDAATMYEIFDYDWTWSARAVWVTFDGVTYAAAMNGMPHGGERITTNDFDGQFCIHFLNSRTHGGNQVNEDMQQRLMEAFLQAQ